MKNMFIAGLALALSIVAIQACQNQHTPSGAATSEAPVAGAKYICPMNCEKGKTYDQPGTCPVCNMKLEPVKTEASAAQTEYFTAFVPNPTQLEAGKPGMLSFTPKIKGNESALVPLDLVHEKKMHLILVSDDLSWFDHIHPEFASSGSYEIKVLGNGENFTSGRGHTETRFESGGKFWAFTDYKPTGGLNQVNKTELTIAGPAAKPVSYQQAKLSTTVDGYTLSFNPEHPEEGFAAGQQLHIPLVIKQGGKVVDPTTFENYLGEKAHLIMVEVNSKEFVHTHPAASNGGLDIHTTFPKAGTYRAWLQFQSAGKVHTADFVVPVGAAEAGHEGHDHGHKH